MYHIAVKLDLKIKVFVPNISSVGRTVLEFARHLHLLMKLRMNVAILLLPVYTLMTWTGTTVPFICVKTCRGYIQIEGDIS